MQHASGTNVRITKPDATGPWSEPPGALRRTSASISARSPHGPRRDNARSCVSMPKGGYAAAWHLTRKLVVRCGPPLHVRPRARRRRSAGSSATPPMTETSSPAPLAAGNTSPSTATGLVSHEHTTSPEVLAEAPPPVLSRSSRLSSSAGSAVVCVPCFLLRFLLRP